RELARNERPKHVTIRTPARGRTARPQTCHRLSSEGFPRVPPPLRVASGTRAKARRLLRKASSRRPKKAAGFLIAGRLPQGGRASAQNPAFSAVRAFWEQVNSRDWPVSFSWQ